MLIKALKKALPILVCFGLLIAIPINSQATTKVMWGKTELKLGQIGKVTILADTPLVKMESNGTLSTVRMLKKGDEYRVYSYKGQHNGLYGVGGSSFVQKNTAKVKYETPSKRKLALVTPKPIITTPVDPPALEVIDIQ
ncbi:hypothetical protein SAMN05421670_2372 [Psychrobacillus psychrotolerans]|uniref:Uncharacterized protein n=1 Tax=Psychrobacillus psychrotolerans TaxID=126156 RepID=A0A1I5Z3Z4_9BACI|nr:hypothetical protein [Psychrobacillus psychrotolerans]SFQ51181.1 hypothetical protein SAMN05421670_2372 [Psychrobacillus psychrotolerans]